MEELASWQWLIVVCYIGLYLVAIFTKSHKPMLIYCTVLGAGLATVILYIGNSAEKYSLAISAFIGPFLSAYIVHYIARGVVLLYRKASGQASS